MPIPISKPHVAKQFMVCNFELKTVDEEPVLVNGTKCVRFTGYASVFNNIDFDRDIISKGAFSQTINRGIAWPILWQHDYKEPIGVNEAAVEDSYGLLVTGLIEVETAHGIRAHVMLKMKAIKGLSIGYRVINSTTDKNGVRTITEIQMFEYSVVTFPANDKAQVTAIKSRVLSDNNVALEQLNHATGYQGFPLVKASSIFWSATKAAQRCFAWANGDWTKYARCFLYTDAAKAEDRNGYLLGYVDIVDGRPTVIPEAIKAIGTLLAGASNYSWMNPAVKSSVKTHVARYYKRMGEEPPFNQKGQSTMKLEGIYSKAEHALLISATAFIANPESAKAADFNSALQEAIQLQELHKLRWVIEEARYDMIEEIVEDETSTVDQKIASIATTFDQYGKAMTTWYKRMLGIQEENDTEADVEAKAQRTMHPDTAKTLNQCMGMTAKAMDLQHTSQKCSMKAMGMHAAAHELTKALVSGGSQTDADDYDAPTSGRKKPPAKGRQNQPPPDEDDPTTLEAKLQEKGCSELRDLLVFAK